MSYQTQVDTFARLGMGALDKLTRETYPELFLSLNSGEVCASIAAVTRLRANELPTPTTVQEMHDDIVVPIFAELVAFGQIKVADYGLSVMGQNQYQELIGRANGDVPAPQDIYSEVVRLYKSNVSEFNSRRASDPGFLERSNAAQAAGLLR